MIKKYSLMALQTAINHALMLDTAMPTKLMALHGKVLEIIISPLQTRFFMRFEQDKILLLADYPEIANATIHSSPLGLIRLSLLPASKTRSLFNEQIQLTGDVVFGQQVKQLFDNIDIDWEGHLAHFTGDVIAYQLGSFVRKGLAFSQQCSQSMSANVTEYVQEELRLCPSAEEVDDFCSDVDLLALRLERLIARVNKLEHEIY